jgi:hypothetical protein
MLQEKCLAISTYCHGSITLKTVQVGEYYETQLAGEKIASALFYLSGRTIPRAQRKPVEVVCQYPSESLAWRGHTQASTLLQRMYGNCMTVTPEED